MKNKVIRFYILVLSCFLGLSSGPVWGFAYDNPAEEAFSETHFELLLPEIGFGAKNNLFNLSNINIDLTKPGVKADFLEQMHNGMFKTDFQSQLKAGLTIGRFSVHIQPWATGSFRLAPGIPELIFVGYGPEENVDEKVYDLAGTKANGLAALSLDFKYGHPIELPNGSELGVGVTFRYVRGLAMFHSEMTNGSLTVDTMGDCTLRTEGQALYADLPGSDEGFEPGDLFSHPPGSGFLIDLGVAYDWERFHGGLVLKNIGALKWQTVQQATFSYEGQVETGPEGPELSEGEPATEEKTLSSYTMGLPVVLQFQGSYRLLKNVYWNLGMETGFADGWGISSNPCFQTGLEWRPRHLIRLAGDVAYHDRHLNYHALLELRLFFLWTRFQLGWTDQLGGINASGMLALHF